MKWSWLEQGLPEAPFLSQDWWNGQVHGETTRRTEAARQLCAHHGTQPRPAVLGQVCPADGLLGWNIPKHRRHCRRLPVVFTVNTEQLGFRVSTWGSQTGDENSLFLVPKRWGPEASSSDFKVNQTLFLPAELQ